MENDLVAMYDELYEASCGVRDAYPFDPIKNPDPFLRLEIVLANIKEEKEKNDV